jgi:D-alanyl-D-alanine carboxypeptidase (penicillin-binding protein 5/6)
MEREYTRYPASAGSQRRKEIEQRIKKMRREKRRSRKQERKGSTRLGRAAILLVILLACLYLSASFLVAVVRASTFDGDTKLYTQDTQPQNLDELSAYLNPDGSKVGPVSSPEIAARSAILMDPDNGQALYEKNADQPLPNASTTKILTGIIAIESCDPNERVTISKRAATTPEQSIWLQEGETLTVEQLLYAMLLRSANDASVALAEHVAGSVEAFAEIMNRRAAEMGATGSHFVTPNGLHDPQHYTTARDLAKIASYCMRNPVFRRIIATESYALPPSPGNQWERICENHNKLLEIYPDANGIKTGYTVPAGKCLVGSAERGGRELISVLLDGGEGYFQDTAKLLDYGFNNFVRVYYAHGGNEFIGVKVGNMPSSSVFAVAEQDLVLNVRKDRLEQNMQGEAMYRKWVDYPVAEGQELGKLRAETDGFSCEINLVAGREVPSPGGLDRIFSFLAMALTFGVVLGLACMTDSREGRLRATGPMPMAGYGDVIRGGRGRP